MLNNEEKYSNLVHTPAIVLKEIHDNTIISVFKLYFALVLYSELVLTNH